MNSGLRHWIAAGCLLCTTALAVGQADLHSGVRAASPDDLNAAGNRTYSNYLRGVNSGDRESGKRGDEREIPEKYWAEPLRALRPVKVYLHRMNMVVVEKCGAGVEEGRYIMLLISSEWPRNGIDGFEFTPDPWADGGFSVPGGVLQYTRRR